VTIGLAYRECLAISKGKNEESKSFVVVVDDGVLIFLETDYVSFQKNELVVSDNEHEYFFKTSLFFGKLTSLGT
jgi:hypothetical protein